MLYPKYKASPVFTKSSGEPVDLTHSVYGRETLSAAGMPCSGLIDA